MPPPQHGRNKTLFALSKGLRCSPWHRKANLLQHKVYLVLSDEGFDLIDVLWHCLLVPLNQGGLSPLDPSQELFQKLCVRHQL